jgi:hypothetical protein
VCCARDSTHDHADGHHVRRATNDDDIHSERAVTTVRQQVKKQGRACGAAGQAVRVAGSPG